MKIFQIAWQFHEFFVLIFSRSSVSVSSSREGSQERKIDHMPTRPPLVRRPSWRRTNVLQKARKFESRQVTDPRAANPNRFHFWWISA